MRERSLYRYFSERRWSDAFVEGQMLFRALSYFQDLEDEGVRGDDLEGISRFQPEGGLRINNLTQGTSFTLADHAFRSEVRADEIFILCASRTFSRELWTRFGAVVCVEVFDVPAFCRRVESTLPGASFAAPPGGRRAIGHRVAYYPPDEAGSPRWALPDYIALSKRDRFRWQDEFRLVFSLTGALGFEAVSTSITREPRPPAARRSHHPEYPLNARELSDICRVHTEWGPSS